MKRVRDCKILASLLAISFLLAACAVDTSPKINSFLVERVLDQAEAVNLSASVSDANSDLQSVVVRWGDGTSDEVNSNFQNIQLVHSYTELNKTYTVELEAVDMLAEKAVDSRQIGVASIARSCQKITEFEFCYDVQPDLLTAKVSIKAFDNQIYEETLSVSNPSIDFFVPVIGDVGQAKVRLSGNFSASAEESGENAVRVQVFACVLGLICTGEIADETFVF